jgi:hypothetical protein
MNKEIKRELMLCISSEGYGSDIFRICYSDGVVKFGIRYSSVFDSWDMDISEKEYQEIYGKEHYFESFHEFWKNFTNNFRWYYSFFSDIHPDINEIVSASISEAKKEDPEFFSSHWGKLRELMINGKKDINE